MCYLGAVNSISLLLVCLVFLGGEGLFCFVLFFAEEPAASILGLKAILQSRQTRLIPVHEEASDSCRSGCAPLVTLTTNGSGCPRNDSHVFVSGGC